MGKYFLIVVGICLFLIGCDVKDKRDPGQPSVVGTWDNGLCQDRLILNDDKTFAWSDTNVYSGNYWIDGNQIDFKFSSKLPEIYQFLVTDKALTLLKQNTQYEYVKVAALINAKGEAYIPPKAQKTSTGTVGCINN